MTSDLTDPNIYIFIVNIRVKKEKKSSEIIIEGVTY